MLFAAIKIMPKEVFIRVSNRISIHALAILSFLTLIGIGIIVVTIKSMLAFDNAFEISVTRMLRAVPFVIGATLVYPLFFIVSWRLFGSEEVIVSSNEVRITKKWFHQVVSVVIPEDELDEIVNVDTPLLFRIIPMQIEQIGVLTVKCGSKKYGLGVLLDKKQGESLRTSILCALGRH